MTPGASTPGRLALVALAIGLSWGAVAGARNEPKDSQYSRDLDKFYAGLRIGEMSLDRQVAGPDDTLKPSLKVTNASGTELLVPARAGSSLAAKPPYLHLRWHWQRLDSKERKDPRQYGSESLQASVIKPAAVITCDPSAGAIKPAQLNLESGEYVAILLIERPDGSLLMTRSATFRVENVAAAALEERERKLKDDRAAMAAEGKAVYANLRPGKLSLSADSMKRGGVIEAALELANISGREVPTGPVLAKEIGLWSTSVSGLRNPSSSPPHRTAIIPSTPGKIAAGEVMRYRYEIDTKYLEPGTYEITVAIIHFGKSPFHQAKARFKVVK